MTLLVSEWFCTNDSILWSSLNFKETQMTYVSFLTIDNDNDINFDTLALWPSIFVLITNCDMEAFASTWHIFTYLSNPVRSCWSCLADKLVWHSWMERVSGVLTRPDFAFPKHSLEWMSREGRQIYSEKDFPWNQMNQVFNGTTPSFAKGLKSRNLWTYEISEKCKQHGNAPTVCTLAEYGNFVFLTWKYLKYQDAIWHV